MRRFVVLGLLAALCALIAAPALAADPPKNSEWSEHYFPSDDGVTMLHADVLRPKGLSDKDKTPVILTVSPYTNHSGATTDFDPRAQGPSDRFYDFLELSNIIGRGYTYVMVDLPGTGGSGGCNDWGGPREQGAVKAAVEWAASQPWSTGRVGMIGKSYDGWTGLMGLAQQPKGLAAVVSMEPVYAGYRYLYDDGVRFVNSLGTPALFQGIDAKPGSTQDDPMYNANGAPQAWCYGVNYGLQQQDDPDSDFWAERDLLRTTKGVDTPLFLTQGFLETNTKADAAFDFYNQLDGPNRAWFGQFDHYRGWERNDAGAWYTGRKTFIDEVMRFFDFHVKGDRSVRAPLDRDPVIEVQDNLGRYRAEKSWPPADSQMRRSSLRAGQYQDDGRSSAYGNPQGIWTFSQQLRHDAWLSGEPSVSLVIDALPRANVVADLYDVAPSGEATLISRGTMLVRGAGSQDISFELYGQDWLVREGHRLGVLITGSNTDWWLHIPTNTTVSVDEASVDLPWLGRDRTDFLPSTKTPTLKSYLGRATTEVTKAEIREAERRFDLPPRLR